MFRPQIGVTHARGPWSYEVTGSVFFNMDNTNFYGGVTRKQDPIYAIQTHVVRTLPKAWWVAGGLGYNRGGESEIDGVPKYDRHSNLLYSISAGTSLTPNQGIKFGFLRGETFTEIGSDHLSFFASWNYRF